jgi:hypothetical protein
VCPCRTLIRDGKPFKLNASASMVTLLTSSVLSGGLGVAAVSVALVSALVGAISFFVNTAEANKQVRLQRGTDAYRAALAWRLLRERVHQPEELKLGDLWERLMTAREESAYHTALLYGESQRLAATYAILIDAVRALYEEEIIQILSQTREGETLKNSKLEGENADEKEKRHAYLAALKRSASFYRTLRSVGLKPSLDPPPDWL